MSMERGWKDKNQWSLPEAAENSAFNHPFHTIPKMDIYFSALFADSGEAGERKGFARQIQGTRLVEDT